MRLGGRWLWVVAMGCALLLAGALAACGSNANNAPPSLPSGTYTSAAYHFSVKYPTGWTAVAIGCAGTQAAGSGCAMLGGTATSSQPVASPLQVTITHT